MAVLIGILAVICTSLGGIFAIKFKDKLHLILGFSAGAVIGVALFDLIPESFELTAKGFDVKYATVFMAAGFALFMILDRLFSIHAHDCEDCHNDNHQGRLGALTLIFHSFLDGLGIGLAFKVSTSVGWIFAAAVLAHDFSDGINTVNMILKNKGKSTEAAKWLLFDALAPVFGILAAYFIAVSEPALGLVLSVFAGFFLYIGASDLIPESHHRHPTFGTTLMTIFGMIVIFVAIQFAM